MTNFMVESSYMLIVNSSKYSLLWKVHFTLCKAEVATMWCHSRNSGVQWGSHQNEPSIKNIDDDCKAIAGSIKVTGYYSSDKKTYMARRGVWFVMCTGKAIYTIMYSFQAHPLSEAGDSFFYSTYQCYWYIAKFDSRLIVIRPIFCTLHLMRKEKL